LEKLYIENFGPIKKCEIEIKHFMVLIGEQASGKSTIAKCVYFCKRLRDEFYLAFIEASQLMRIENPGIISNALGKAREKFKQLFGSAASFEPFIIRYSYSMDIWLEIKPKKDDEGEPTLSLEISNRLTEEINKLAKFAEANLKHLKHNDVSPLYQDSQSSQVLFAHDNQVLINSIKNGLILLFDDPCEYLYVPSGRSVISAISDFIEMIYKDMNHKDMLIYDFMKNLISFRKRFKNIDGLLQSKKETQNNEASPVFIKNALTFNERILKGSYDYDGSQERILINGTSKLIDFNKASSGQQESVWIINLLLYYVVHNINCHVFIEEPEAHLYPTAQQDIVRFIVNFFNANKNNKVFIPTHSPYVLSEINNLIYAERLQGMYPAAKDAVCKLVIETTLLQCDHLGVYNILDAKAEDILDAETMLIDFMKLDNPAAKPINELFDKLYDLEDEYGGD
jgi:ABC-type lipoprotein export system ATPase subunit